MDICERIGKLLQIQFGGGPRGCFEGVKDGSSGDVGDALCLSFTDPAAVNSILIAVDYPYKDIGKWSMPINNADHASFLGDVNQSGVYEKQTRIDFVKKSDSLVELKIRPETYEVGYARVRSGK